MPIIHVSHNENVIKLTTDALIAQFLGLSKHNDTTLTINERDGINVIAIPARNPEGVPHPKASILSN